MPVGTVDWTWDSALDGRPPYGCHGVQSGSLPTGGVHIPQDQMLFLQRDGADHLRYWGNGTLFIDTLDCGAEYAGGSPGWFFWIQVPDADAPKSDESTAARPQCATLTWRIEREATRITGTCWLYDEPGYEDRVDWDLERVPKP